MGSRAKQKRASFQGIILFEKKADLLAQLDQFDPHRGGLKSLPKKKVKTTALIQSLTGLEAGSKLLFIFCGPEGGLSPAEIESSD